MSEFNQCPKTECWNLKILQESGLFPEGWSDSLSSMVLDQCAEVPHCRAGELIVKAKTMVNEDILARDRGVSHAA